nr:hypothetical protein OH826_33625 [Streptomyces sp. NBC_00899]
MVEGAHRGAEVSVQERPLTGPVVVLVRQVVPPAATVGGTDELLEQGTAQEGVEDILPVARCDGHIAGRRQQQGVAVHGVIDGGEEGVHSGRFGIGRRCREVRAIHGRSLADIHKIRRTQPRLQKRRQRETPFAFGCADVLVGSTGGKGSRVPERAFADPKDEVRCVTHIVDPLGGGGDRLQSRQRYELLCVMAA